MELMQLVSGRKERKPLGVCIPDHRKDFVKDVGKKSSSNSPTKELLVVKEGEFRVTGSYRVMDTLMLSGIVQEGSIRKRMKAKKDGKQIRVTDVRRGNGAVENLFEGEEGTIFISAKATPIIGLEDVLAFKG